MQNNVEE